MTQQRGSMGSILAFVMMAAGALALYVGIASRSASLSDDLARFLMPGGVIAILAGLGFGLMSLSARADGRRNRALLQIPEVVEVVSVGRTGALSTNFRAFRQRSEMGDSLPFALPPFFGLAIEKDGLGLWGGNAKCPQRMGLLSWSVVEGLQSATVRDGLSTFPGIEARVASGEVRATLPFILRGGLGGIGAASSAETQRFVARALEVKADPGPR